MKSILFRLRAPTLLAWVCVWPLLGPLARADLSHTFQSHVVGNYTGYLINSDSLNADPAYNRNSIRAEVAMQYARVGMSDFHYDYRFDFQLLNGSGVPQILASGLTTLTVIENVNMTAGPSPINRTTLGHLVPQNKLSPYDLYRAKVTVLRRVAPAGSWQILGITEETTAAKYRHFDSMISGDASLNILSEVDNPIWNRIHRLQNDPDGNFFRVRSLARLDRYDGFAAGAPSSTAATVRFSVQVRDDLGNLIPLQQSSIDIVRDIANFVEGSPRLPRVDLWFQDIDVRPVSQLLSRSRTYEARVTIGVFDGGMFPVAGNSDDTPLQRLLDFNGTLAFAGTSGTVNKLASPFPTVGDLGPDYVETSIRVPVGEGSFQGLTFGTGSPIPVELRNNGVATLASGSIGMTGNAQPGVPGQMPYLTQNVVATPEGLTGNIRLTLPSGLGLGGSAQSTIHDPYLFFTNVALQPNLSPLNATVHSPGLRWAAEESKPFVFESSSVAWDVALDRLRFAHTGDVRFVRRDHYDTLSNDPLVPAGQKVKPSNDSYYWNLDSILGAEVLVETDANNGSALLSADLGFGQVLYTAHYPVDAFMGFNSAEMRVTRDRVIPGFGGAEGAGLISLHYAQDCPGVDCGSPVGLKNVVLFPTDQKLRFTRDGGLAGAGSLSQPLQLTWAWVDQAADFAHQAVTFTEGQFHMPGHFMASAQIAGSPPNQPARLLFTGVAADGSDQVERAGSAAYTAGLGDYAGFNLRADNHTGRLVLGGQSSAPFPLTSRSKYYIRRSGVSGVHEAVNGQFSPQVTLYGLDFTLDTLGWAFLGSEAVDSRTAGSLSVPYPSNFDLAFERLMISCQGALLGAEIAAADADQHKKLDYWNADFIPLTLGFAGKEDDACDPSARRLVLGVQAYAGGIPVPLSGTWGFRTNGNLITLDSNELDPPFDSRLKLPNRFDIAGPGGVPYAATPVGDAYLNDHAAAPAADFGWMNIAAHVDIPFFSDLEVHLHTSAVMDDPSVTYHMMGGYPGKGFSKDGKHFFNESIFDTSNRGFPLDVSFAQYRSGLPAPNDKYRPVARKRWLNVVDFEYPLQWRPASRSFASFTDMGNKFLVMETQHRIDFMTSEFLEVSFGAGFSTVPKLNIANFVADKATDVTAILQEKLQTQIVDQGINALNEVLDVKQREFFEKALAPAIDAAVDRVFQTVSPNWLPANKTWLNPNLVPSIELGLLDPGNGLAARFNEAMGAARDAVGVLREIDLRLAQAENALTKIEEYLEAGPGKPVGNVQDTVLGLAKLVSAALDKPEFAEKITALLDRAAPRIAEVRVLILEVRDAIAAVRSAMDEGGQYANQVIKVIDDNALSIQGAVLATRNDIEALLKEVKTGADQLSSLEPALRAKMKQRMMDRMTGLPVIKEFNRLAKQRLYDTSALLTSALDEVFDQINLTVRDVVREVAGGLDQAFEQMLGDVAPVMATANVDGYAKVRNDSLTELRMDLKVKMDIPDDMKAHVFLLIRELSSENSPAECLPASGKATEVTMGAKDIAVEWLFPDVSMNLSGKFVFNGDGDGFPLLGLGGGIDLVGAISFADSVVIKKLGASVMFGKFENYISAAAQVEVQGFGGGGGIFIGRACSLDPFFWDPVVAAVIGEPPFTGVYGYGEFWIPIPTLIGIPSTCLFNLSAGVGAGAGFFIEGPTVFGKMFLGISGDVLCIVSITGEITLVGLARPSGLSLAGQGRFAVALGWCPICLKFDKSIRLVKEGKKWSRSVK